MIRAGIVEDHPLFGQAIMELISTIPDLTVLLQTDSAEGCLAALRNTALDLLLIDLQLKGINGLELLKMLHQNHSHIRVIIISMHPEETWGERVLRAGARGYISKTDTPKSILRAIGDVLDGKLAYSDKLKEMILMDQCKNRSTVVDSFQKLTDRELEVFYLLGLGQTTRSIAEKLHLSVKTVETYRERIKHRLNLSNSNQLLQQASLWVARCNGFPDNG